MELPDDNEQAVWPWLKHVGFNERGDERSVLACGPFTVEVLSGTGGTSLWLDNKPVCDEPTRGQVRSLCRGINWPIT